MFPAGNSVEWEKLGVLYNDEHELGLADMVHSTTCVPEVVIPLLRKLMSFASASERLFNVEVRDSSDRAAWLDEAEGRRAKRGRGRGRRPKLGCAVAAETKDDTGGVDRPAMGRLATNSTGGQEADLS